MSELILIAGVMLAPCALWQIVVRNRAALAKHDLVASMGHGAIIEISIAGGEWQSFDTFAITIYGCTD